MCTVVHYDNKSAMSNNFNTSGSVIGNSEEETDEREMFDTKLASIARGQVNPDWDILFGDGEIGADGTLFVNGTEYSNSKMVFFV